MGIATWRPEGATAWPSQRHMLVARFQRGLRVAVDATLPARCVHCGQPAHGGAWSPFLCSRCVGHLRYCSGAVELSDGRRAYASFRFEGPARSLLHALKYHGVTATAGPLGKQLASLIDGHGVELVVPIPLHWRRRWVRGHNQARTLARQAARSLPTAMLCDALVRVRATAPQVGLGRARRRANLAGAFALRTRSRRRIAGRRIALIDDVLTTGRTMIEASAVLSAHGARQVTLVAVAAAPTRV